MILDYRYRSDDDDLGTNDYTEEACWVPSRQQPQLACLHDCKPKAADWENAKANVLSPIYMAI